ncbi:MAG: carbohydrate-binding protein [Streptosporangiaceae bacterium]|nr:carbohydrate-binding protein [Streptosporangiaceae bacterium]
MAKREHRRPLRRYAGRCTRNGAGSQLRHRRPGRGLQRHLGQRHGQQLPPDGADLENCSDTGCGLDLGWTTQGQWFRYTVNTTSAGNYTVSFRVASPGGVTDALHIADTSGTSLSGPVNVPATGGWQNWTTVTASVTLPAGQQILVLDQDSGGWNIRYMSFARSSGGTNLALMTSLGSAGA